MREKIIRIFVSSTFIDFECERNLFQGDIEKELSNEYKSKGWQIEFIDLRWGIDSEVKNTMSVCIDELEKCRNVSPIPFLFILLGNRYGWIPIPEILYENQWNYVLEYAKNNNKECYKILIKEYIEDSNNIPKRYLLKAHLDSKCQEYNMLLSMLSDIEEYYNSDNNIIEDWINLAQSATHNEISYGVDVLGGDNSKTLCFFRNIRDVEDSKYIDNPEFVESLKKELRNKINDDSIIECNIDFEDYNTSNYSKIFKDKIISKLKSIIDSEINNYNDNVFDNDIYFQEQFVYDRLKIFFGREAEELKFSEMIDCQRKIIVSGSSGCGKSSFMAKLYSNCLKDGKYEPIFCSVGISPSSHTGVDILNYIAFRLSTKQNGNLINSRTFEEIIDYILKADNNNTIIFIDAINQLHQSDPLLKLINMNFSNNCRLKFVFSIIEEEVSSVNLTNFSPNTNKIELKLFKIIDNTLINIVKRHLNQNNRIITTSQEKFVKQILQEMEFISPLYLRLISLICSMLNHNDEIQISDNFLIKNISDNKNIFYIPTSEKEIIKGVITYYSNEKKHCKTMTNMALSFISHSLRGVTYGEMLDLISEDEDTFNVIQTESKHDINSCAHKLPPTIWSHLYYDIKHLLSTSIVLGGEVITYYHSIINKTVKELVSDNASSYKSINMLLNYHKNQWEKFENIRSLEELPELYLKLEKYEELKDLLLDVNYIQKKAENGRMYDLIREYEITSKKVNCRLFNAIYENIKRQSQLFTIYSNSDKDFTLQFICNLFADKEIKEFTYDIIKKKRHEGKLSWLFQILNLPYYNDNCAIEKELHGALWSICDIVVTEDGKWCLSVDDDKTCKVWDMEKGEVENTYFFHDDEVKYCSIINAPHPIAVTSSKRDIYIWNLLTGEILSSIKTDNDIMAISLLKDTNHLLVAQGNIVILYKETERKWTKWKEITLDKIVSSLCVNANNCIVACDNGNIYIIDIYLSKIINKIEDIDDRIISVGTLNEDYILAITRTALIKYNIRNMCISNSINGDFTILESNNEIIATGAVNGMVTLWSSDLELLKSYRVHSKDVTALYIQQAENKVVSASRDRHISIIDISKDGNNNLTYSSCVYLSYNGSDIYSISDSCELLKWELNNKEFRSTIISKDFNEDCFAIDISPNNNYVAVSIGDDRCKLWDKKNNTLINLPATTINTFINAVRFSHNGKYLAINSVGDSYYAESTILSIYDISDIDNIKVYNYSRRDLGLTSQKDRYNERRRLDEVDNKYYILHINGAYGLDFTKDDNNIAIAMSNNSILLFDYINNKYKIFNKGKYTHTNEVKTVAFTPDGKYLISGSWDNNAIIWDVENFTSIGVFMGHTRGIYAMDISICGSYLITGARDHTIILWNIETRKLIKRFVYTSSVNSLKFIAKTENSSMKFVAGFDSGDVLCIEITGDEKNND